jgi:transcription initiation factor TFIIIB Brf1 subunit/transcription initiation factor TFIIB
MTCSECEEGTGVCSFCVLEELSKDDQIPDSMCCENPNFVTEEFTVCTNCGITEPDHVIDMSAEYTNYKQECGGLSVNNTRCSKTTDDLKEYSLSTSISGNNNKSNRMNKMNNYNTFTHKQKVISDLYQLFSNLEEYGISRGVVNHAITLFLKLTGHDDPKNKSKRNIFKGAPRRAMIAICLDSAYQEFNSDRFTHQICQMIGVPVKKFYKMIPRYNEIMNLSQPEKYIKTDDTPNLVRNYCNELRLPYKIQNLILLILDSAINLRVFKQDKKQIKPKSIILGVIYTVMIQFEKKQIYFNIHKKLGITESTLKAAKRVFEENQDLIYSDVKKKLIMNIYRRAK